MLLLLERRHGTRTATATGSSLSVSCVSRGVPTSQTQSLSSLSHLSIEKGEEKYRRYIQYTQRLFAFFGSLSRAKEFPFRLASLLFIRLTMFSLSCRSNNRRCESTSILFSTILLLLFGECEKYLDFFIVFVLFALKNKKEENEECALLFFYWISELNRK